MNENSINTAPKAIRNDSLAELFTFHSPYSYAFNNPVNWSYPSGLAPEKAGSKDRILEEVPATQVGDNEFVTATVYCVASRWYFSPYSINIKYESIVQNNDVSTPQMDAQSAFIYLNMGGGTISVAPAPNSEIGGGNGAGCGGSSNISIDKPMNYISGNRTSNVVSDNTQTTTQYVFDGNIIDYSAPNNNESGIFNKAKTVVSVTGVSATAVDERIIQKASNKKLNKAIYPKRKVVENVLKNKTNVKKIPSVTATRNAIRNGSKTAAKKLSFVGLSLVAVDVAFDGEVRPSHLYDATVCGLTMIPYAGWGIGATALVADFISYSIDGKTIGDRLDEEFKDYIYDF